MQENITPAGPQTSTDMHPDMLQLDTHETVQARIDHVGVFQGQQIEIKWRDVISRLHYDLNALAIAIYNVYQMEHRMRVEGEYKKTGYFWLPGGEENKIPGTLTINNGGEIELEIVGHFNDSVALQDVDDFPRVIGHIEKDGLVTLDDCFYKSKNMSFGGISKSLVNVNRVFSGAAWGIGETVMFNEFSFSFDCLDSWVGISGLKVDSDSANKTATISYDPPKKITYQLDNDLCLEICFSYTLPGYPNITEAKISQRAYFRLKSENSKNVDEFIDVAHKINGLMSFAMDESVSLKEVIATSSEIQRNISDDSKIPVPIYVYYRSVLFSEKIPKKNWHEMLFDFKAIKTNAQRVFNNWINAYEFLAPAISLYFSTKNGGQKYLEGKFLALAQGLETYHRRTNSETLMSQNDFESMVLTILISCPGESQSWLAGRLNHGNELNLGKRLKSIVEPFKMHLGSSDKRSRVLRKIVDTRNYLTHYSEDLKGCSATGRDLWVLCEKMEAIFKLNFLKVIGFTEYEIARVVNNCYPMRRALDLD